MKICVYSIAKNESANVAQYMASIKAAGLETFVLDTGSVDDTASLLEAHGAHVTHGKVFPWDFSDARNMALAFVPEEYDICISLDLDEVVAPNIADLISQAVTAVHDVADEIKNALLLLSRFVYLYQPDTRQARLVLDSRIHGRAYRWKYPVHECLVSTTEPIFKEILISQHLISHTPADTRRRTYTPQLRAAVEKFPRDIRMNLLLARDLYNDGAYADARKQFDRALCLDAKCAEASYMNAMVARCWKRLGNRAGEALFLGRATHLSIKPRRESWVDLANYHMRHKGYKRALTAIQKAIDIEEGQFDPFSEPMAWDSHPYEVKMLAEYYLELFTCARKSGEHALTLTGGEQTPEYKRITENLKQITEMENAR